MNTVSTTQPTPIEIAAAEVLQLLVRAREVTQDRGELSGAQITEHTGLEPHDVDDAVALLRDSGYVEWVQYLDNGGYAFSSVWVTPAGRREGQRLAGIFSSPIELKSALPSSSMNRSSSGPSISLPPTPIGSPFGFADEDWEHIASAKAKPDELRVVMGYQFRSAHYDSETLKQNVQGMFSQAVAAYNGKLGSIKTELAFSPLAAGYGEHLFNEIARKIIAADIAVFDTSDLNPNVMLELGVALTWGVRVLPIKHHLCPKPPSDVSGQTWADYEDSAAAFTDAEHHDKLVSMVQRAVAKKGRPR